MLPLKLALLSDADLLQSLGSKSSAESRSIDVPKLSRELGMGREFP